MWRGAAFAVIWPLWSWLRLRLCPCSGWPRLGGLPGRPFFLGLIAYLVWAYLNPQGAALDTEHTPAQPLWQALGWLVAGLCALMLGARLLVDGAVSIAHALGLSEAFIGLTIVAVGTSLPELATSVMAARRKQSAIAIGNIVGSNIFNVLGILGITALIAPIPVADRFLRFDLPVMIAASVVLALMLLMREGLGRRAGAVLLLAYAGFVWAAQG